MRACSVGTGVLQVCTGDISSSAVTVVEILEVKENRIWVTGLDALHGTPILDIKPYEEHFDFDTPLGLLWEMDPDYRPVDKVGSGWDKGHAIQLEVCIRLTWFRFHAAAPRMPRSLLRGCAAVTLFKFFVVISWSGRFFHYPFAAKNNRKKQEEGLVFTSFSAFFYTGIRPSRLR
ncbi:MAG: SAM-dependent methyltransferase [Methanotrichaceae archaeon]|nr:SAM-dependent methyltransferase [Methanotrichaceae archaeon]